MSTITTAKPRPKFRLITDPEELARICARQPTVSREEAERSILEGVQAGRWQKRGKNSSR